MLKKGKDWRRQNTYLFSPEEYFVGGTLYVRYCLQQWAVMKAIPRDSVLLPALISRHQFPPETPKRTRTAEMTVPQWRTVGTTHISPQITTSAFSWVSLTSHLGMLMWIWCRRLLIYVGVSWHWPCTCLLSCSPTRWSKTEPEVASCPYNCSSRLFWDVRMLPFLFLQLLSWDLITSWYWETRHINMDALSWDIRNSPIAVTRIDSETSWYTA